MIVQMLSNAFLVGLGAVIALYSYHCGRSNSKPFADISVPLPGKRPEPEAKHEEKLQPPPRGM